MFPGAATMAAMLALLPLGHPGNADPDSVPLYDDLGSHHYAVTTSVPRAQAYFDQGLRLTFAFNHQEAVASYRLGGQGEGSWGATIVTLRGR